MKSIDDVPEELRGLYRLNLDIFITTLESSEKVIGKEAPLGIIRLSAKKLGDRIERELRKRTKTREWTPKTLSDAFVDHLNDLGLEAELVSASDEEIIRKHVCLPDWLIARVGEKGSGQRNGAETCEKHPQGRPVL